VRAASVTRGAGLALERLRLGALADPWRLLFLALAAVLAYLTAVPLVILLLASVRDAAGGWTLTSFVTVFTSPSFLLPVQNTLIVALAVGALAALVGTPLAWLVARTDLPFRRVVQFLVICSYVTPPFLAANAWVLLAGPNAGWLNRGWQALSGSGEPLFNVFSLQGLIFVLFLYTFPFTFIGVSSALQLLAADMEEAAAILGANSWHTMKDITLPLALPAIVSGFTLALLESITVFGAPAMLALPARLHTVTTRMYGLFDYPPQEHLAAAYALPLLLATALLLYLQRRMLGRRGFATITGKAGTQRLVRLDRWKYPALAVALGMVGLAVLLPYGQMLVTSLSKAWGQPPGPGNITLDNYHFLFTYPAAQLALVNSVKLAVLAATLGLVLALAVAYVVRHRLVLGGGVLAFLAMSPMVVPSIVLAVALFVIYTNPALRLYGTIWILLIAYLTKYLPVAFAGSANSLRSLHPDLEEAARIAGANRLVALWDVTLPLVAAGLASTWLLVFMPALRELSASVILVSPQSMVASVLFWQLYAEGKFEIVSALGVLLMLVTFAALLVSFRIAGGNIIPRQRD
jgi:iron(III) transport system permease protein